MAKLEIEPKAPGSRIGSWPRAWGRPGTLPQAVLGQRRQGDVGLTKAPCWHLFKPMPVLGYPSSRCSVGLVHPQASLPGTRPHEKVRQNPALQWRLLIYIFSASLSVFLMLLTRRRIFDTC